MPYFGTGPELERTAELLSGRTVAYRQPRLSCQGSCYTSNRLRPLVQTPGPLRRQTRGKWRERRNFKSLNAKQSKTSDGSACAMGLARRSWLSSRGNTH